MQAHKKILFGLAMALVLLLPGAGQAAYDLNGNWTFSYSLSSGETFNDPCVIEQTENRFSGTVSYTEEGQQYQETFEGLVNQDGSVVFTLYENGDPVYHHGQISPDGKTITGSWSVGENSGSFSITRGSSATTAPPPAGIPDLSGNWDFSFTNPKGQTFTDPAVIQQAGSRISGTLTYQMNGQARTGAFEGTVSSGGVVDMTLNDQGTLVQHTGQVSQDGKTIAGDWRTDSGSQGPFVMTRQGATTQTSTFNLTGDWVFSFDTADDKSYSDPCTIQQNGDSFSGQVSYYQGGQEAQEPFDGTIKPDGSVEFTLYDMGQPVPHVGRISPDGNTISGTWAYDDGQGTFTITRGGYVTGLPAPNAPSQGDTSGLPDLSGSWTFNYTVPDGTNYSDPATITQNGTRFSGTVTYLDDNQEVTNNFEGTIQADGSVAFTLYESGEPVEHWGKLAPDGRSISGEWSVSGGSGTFTLVRN